MTRAAVVAFGAVGYLPAIHIGVLVILNEPLDGAVEVDHIRVSNLLPATPALTYRASVI